MLTIASGRARGKQIESVISNYLAYQLGKILKDLKFNVAKDVGKSALLEVIR